MEKGPGEGELSWIKGKRMELNTKKPIYDSDGLRTVHFVPFLLDEKFEEAYRKAIFPLDPDKTDVRYRAYIIKWAASQVRHISGNFVECGTYDAKAVTLILNLEDLKGHRRKFLLFDTFSGIPSKGLTEREINLKFEGMYSDVTLEEVKEKLKDYLDVIEFHVGIIPDTFKNLKLEPVAFLHLDLNAAMPTKRALDFFYPALQPGGVIIFDDYGWEGFEDQREVIDSFFSDKIEQILVLPTGQGVVIRQHNHQFPNS